MEKKEGYTVFSGPVKGPKGEKAIIQAEKHGKEVETFKKVQHTNKGNLDAKHVAKLLGDDETVNVPVMSHDLRIAIQQARNEKKMNQEQLAQAISEPKTNISAYEAGKMVPTGATIARIQKVLGVKLPRPEKKKVSND